MNEVAVKTEKIVSKPILPQPVRLGTARVEVHHKDKPLMQVRVKLKQDAFVSANVYKDDTPSMVADRIFRNAQLNNTKDAKDKKAILANIIEQQINQHIYSFKS